jgi:hypothetical protein
MSETVAKRKRRYFRQALTSLLLATVLTAVLAACDQRPTNTDHAARQNTPTATATSGTIYLDPKLGFRLTLPIGWQAISHPGRHQPSGNTLVTLEEPAPTPATITIGIFHSASMPAAFACEEHHRCASALIPPSLRILG